MNTHSNTRHVTPIAKPIKLGMDEASVGHDLNRYCGLTLGRDEDCDSHHYLYSAVALTIRDRLVERWRATRDRYMEENPKRVAYLSLEFLMGRALNNAVLNLDLETQMRTVLQQYACELEDINEEELDAGLGNGGLGRLAACFLDSCASLQLPVTGYGIRYEYGMFHQKIKNGYQVEYPDHWLRNGNPWEIESPENARSVKFLVIRNTTWIRMGRSGPGGYPPVMYWPYLMMFLYPATRMERLTLCVFGNRKQPMSSTWMSLMPVAIPMR
jgi:glucan phosphorylase